MTFILIFCFLWALFLSFFILSPLLSASQKRVLPSSKSNHNAKLLERKKNLFAKLAFGTCTDAHINSLSEDEALQNCVDVCEELEILGLNWKYHEKHSNELQKESGNSPLSCLFFILAILSVSFFLFSFSSGSFAQNLVQGSTEATKQTIPKNVKIPPATILPGTEFSVPSINQYILSPEQGQLHVYYVGMFSNDTKATKAQILLPFPKGISNVVLHSKESALLENAGEKSKGEIILNTPLDPEVNEIQGEFIVPAANGSADWEKNTLKTLPGVTIVMLNSESSKLNHFPKDFFSLNSDPQSKANSNENFSEQFVRVGNADSAFPEFEVVHIVPSRIFIYGLILFFAFFFVACFAVSLFKLRSSS
jgi:hypothetical protein